MVALGIFTIAFLYVIYTAANSLNPYLEKTDYIDVQLTAFTSIEKIISDPTYDLVSKNHVLSYDKMIDFVSKEDTALYPWCPLESSTNSYIGLLRKLGLIDYVNKKSVFDIQILISSTFTEVDTIAILKQKDIDDFNYILPINPSTGVTYSPSDPYPPHFNTERIYFGDKYYELLVVDENNNSEYDHIYIDANMNKDFQDEVAYGFYGYDAGIPKSGFTKNQNFILESRSYIIAEINTSGEGVQILNIDSADITLGRRRSYSDIVLVMSRLVLVEEFGELSEKRVTIIMWDGNRLCS
ncbi:MAG: hypothetical protein GYA51_13740 [Candidatus Methanofastidiosa archaeon]|jgi:hypothetical protein|nr:hypothetical protein [Candidatus Methanofastidiosa archaeon]